MNLKDEFLKVKAASQKLVSLNPEVTKKVLLELSNHLIASTETILSANKLDLDRMDPTDPTYDRLLLNEERIKGMANEMCHIAMMPSPLSEILEKRKLNNGLDLKKVRVPLGVIGVIYEARPNVTADVFAICFKSGNACILKGGSDAKDSSAAIVQCIHDILRKNMVDTSNVYLMPPEREHLQTLLEARDIVDILIPRGSKGLINFVRENAKIPTIETGAGIVHTYVDETANISQAAEIIFNAKTRRPSVCNALDCLIIHKDQLENLDKLTKALAEANVEIFADEKSYEAIKDSYPSNLLKEASDKAFGIEFLSLKLAIKTVSNLDEALEHIAKYSSKHSEAILSENEEAIDRFLKVVDAAAVYSNTSTCYTDGAEFGLGAEIGISTQKLHARGPMSLKEMTSYKWVLRGNGEIRS